MQRFTVWAENRGAFRCPGCKLDHNVGLLQHSWNGSTESPTLSPSVLVTSGHYIEGATGACWCDFKPDEEDRAFGFTCYRCHSYVRDGMIEFLSDCSHELAGQTVPLPEHPYTGDRSRFNPTSA